MNENEFVKDPGATLDYMVDWTDWLGADTISTSTWVVASGITKVSDTKTNTTATIWLSGGSGGQLYPCTNIIVTNGGRTDNRSILIYVQEK